jgi:hypothetical protein
VDAVNLPLVMVDGRWRIRIGDVWYEFPEGTTREHVEEVFEEAKRSYLEMFYKYEN